MYWQLNLMLFVCYIHCQDQPIIPTTCGTVQGVYLQSRNGRTFSAFFGIPFAKPPIGELRFEPPQPVIDCPVFINASVEGPQCLQPNYNFPLINQEYVGSEDCLNLNIYTPNVTTDDLLPVMVYLYEGSWVLNGNSKQLHGPEYFMDEDIVLVVPNNRLHIFGYMSTEDYVVPGNMALKDQVAALQYVQDNIKFFNGDPDRVTIFGESAGASTTNLHMRSSLSKGLFKQGISQSGTASSAYSIIGVGTSLNFTKSIAARVNCDNVDTQQLVNCLRTIDAEKLAREHMNFLFSKAEARALFRPVVELKDVPGAFLTKTSLLTTTSYPWMTGFNTKDIGYKYGGFAKRGIDKVLALYDKNWDTLGPITLLFDDTSSDPVGVAEKVKKYYFQDDPITKEKKDEMTEMYTNFFITNPMIFDIRNNRHPTYVYQFDHLGEYTKAKGYGLPKKRKLWQCCACR
uniref:Carboxylesterase type B domain-containing protein n=2 Tax=Clastoptera arizonana TaxID=38151 RepID=A0A1B6C6N1_9HEMI